MGVIAALPSCASPARAPRDAAARNVAASRWAREIGTTTVPATDPASFPTGWYTVERCEGTTDKSSVYRFTREGWSVLIGETHVRRTDARFSGEGDGFAATYDAGFVHYQVDLPQGGFFGLSEEATGEAHLRRDAEALKLRLTSSSPHTNHAVSCRLVPATRAQAERFDRAVVSAEDPAHCARAAECCRALGGISACHEEKPHCRSWVPICEKAPGTDPQSCSSWLAKLPFDLHGQPRGSLPTVCR